jgi:Ca2+-binding EF-hand superfamily protein
VLKLLTPQSAIVVAALVFPVQADELADDTSEPRGADPAAMFAELDTNGDGALSEDEVPGEHRRLFKRLLRTADADDNGTLSGKEFAAGISGASDAPRRPGRPDGPRGPNDTERGPDGRPDPKRLFERLDANEDGKVTLDEVPEQRRDQFRGLMERADQDGDEALSQEEFARATRGGRPRPDRATEGKRPEGGPEGRGKNRPEGRGQGRPEGRPDPRQFFERLDADGDGRVTLDEVPEQARPRIEQLIQRVDKNDDGAITIEEFTAMRRPGNAGKGRPEGRPGQGPPGKPGAARPNRPDRGPAGDRRGGSMGLFRALDADRDGKLDDGEISEAANVLLKLDRNGDGHVTVEEVGAAGQKRNKNK